MAVEANNLAIAITLRFRRLRLWRIVYLRESIQFILRHREQQVSGEGSSGDDRDVEFVGVYARA